MKHAHYILIKKVKINLESENKSLKDSKYSLSYYTNNLKDLDK